MNEQIKPKVKVKEKNSKKELVKEKLFTIENNIICIDNEKILDNYIKIIGNLNVIDFMNEFANEMGNLYDIKIIDKKLKFNIIIRKEDKNKNNDKNHKDYHIENFEEIEKELSIQVELFKVKNDEFILNFIKGKGEMDDYYNYLTRIIKYSKDFI